jgi:hypothetical protein
MQDSEERMSEEVKVKLVEVDINRISLQPGDVLLAKVKGLDWSDETIEELGLVLRKAFPNNKVGVFNVEQNQIDFDVISQQAAEVLKTSVTEESSCNTTKFCDDCSCGKKERSVENTASKVMEKFDGLMENLKKAEEEEKQNGNK